jgi:TonB-dependent receptor
VNGLFGVGLDFGEHTIRWTNVYIHDTIKQTRISAGFDRNVNDQDPNLPPSLIEQDTYWFERQLFDTQLVGEFEFGDFSLDVRGTYANTQRESPYERSIRYRFLGDNDPATKSETDVDDYVNNLSSAGQGADIAFSDLNEDLWAGAVDVGYQIPVSFPITVSAGYNYADTQRSSSRFEFQYFRPGGALPLEVAQERPDFLLSDFNIFFYDIELRDISGAEGAAAYDADLEVHAGYAQVELEPIENVRIQGGVRYEDATQTVQPIGTNLTPTLLENNYWLPAATLTWNIRDELQLRLHGSRTIARPQFRELAPQVYQDFESDREFTGNPFLVDSELTNAEARLEYYFRPDQRITVAGFYKNIENPIETAAFFASGQNQLRAGFANAPSAELYGAEVEAQVYFPLESLGGSFFDTRRLLIIGNYTYTRSSITSDDSIIVGPDLQPVAANLLFRDGAPLTGQSDHLANLQIGVEDTDSLSQMTFLVTYASERVTNRGPIQGQLRQPDFIERPGLRLDFVLRQEARLLGTRLEFKFEARNILGTDYEEFQEFGDNRIEINSYDVGRTFSLSVKAQF